MLKSQKTKLFFNSYFSSDRKAKKSTQIKRGNDIAALIVMGFVKKVKRKKSYFFAASPQKSVSSYI